MPNIKKTAGKICVKPSFFFEWKIPNYFSELPEDGCYSSPEFEFCGAKWFLVIRPNRFLKNWMVLQMVKRSCLYEMHNVSYKVVIMNAEHVPYVSAEKNHTYYGASFYTLNNFFKTSELLGDKKKVAPEGTLIIFCTLRCEYSVDDSLFKIKEKAKDELEKTTTNNTENKEESNVNVEEEATSIVTDFGLLSQNMEALFISGENSDMTLFVQDREFLVHRAILGARSAVFAAMFKHDMDEKKSGSVNILDSDPEVFHDFLLYLYSAKLPKFSSENAVGLYSVSDKYNIDALKAKCVEFMTETLSVSMFCNVVSLAIQHQEWALLESTTKFFVKNMKQIVRTVEWQIFMKENSVVANELLVKASDFYVAPKEI